MSRHSVALRRLRRWSPEALRHVTGTLRRAGGQAFVVGGVVRDAFLNRQGADWDVATDLKPAAVAELFRHVVRAGEKHGTIMVIEGGMPIEVTTFRGEGPYVDGRRPSFVEFHTDIEGDLARRDFTMNAIAVDLDGSRWVDPFDGVGAIERRVITCVGDPRERFREDGLRPLRAVRFASVLEFAVEPITREALGAELPTFERVAWERKRVELEKLLLGPAVVSAIELLSESGLLGALAPELLGPSDALTLLPRLPPDPWLRVAAWAHIRGLTEESVNAVLLRFKTSSQIQRRVGAWVDAMGGTMGPPDPGQPFRRWLSAVGVEGARGALELWVAQRSLTRDEARRIRRRLQRPPPHRLADLALSGRDLLALGLEGPEVGRTMRSLLEWVIEEPRRNKKRLLVDAAHRLSTSEVPPEDA